VLATDIAENLVRYLERDSAAAGLTQVRAAVMDGEDLRVLRGWFDAVICRLGLIYLPDRKAALSGMRAALRRGGRLGAIVYLRTEHATDRVRLSWRSSCAAWPTTTPLSASASPTTSMPPTASTTGKWRDGRENDEHGPARDRHRLRAPAPPIV
jgi:ubiquinone/menaquinone biosynthesis C-methylase UbiE